MGVEFGSIPIISGGRVTGRHKKIVNLSTKLLLKCKETIAEFR